MTDYTPPEPQPWRTEEEARQWAADFGGSGDPYGLPLWYHSPTQQGLVLFEDGVTTPADLALEIASGPTDYNCAAVHDVFVTAAALVSIAAAAEVGQARQRDADEETFYSQRDLANAEEHYAASTEVLAAMQAERDAAQALEAASGGRPAADDAAEREYWTEVDEAFAHDQALEKDALATYGDAPVPFELTEKAEDALDDSGNVPTTFELTGPGIPAGVQVALLDDGHTDTWAARNGGEEWAVAEDEVPAPALSEGVQIDELDLDWAAQRPAADHVEEVADDSAPAEAAVSAEEARAAGLAEWELRFGEAEREAHGDWLLTDAEEELLQAAASGVASEEVCRLLDDGDVAGALSAFERSSGQEATSVPDEERVAALRDEAGALRQDLEEGNVRAEEEHEVAERIEHLEEEADLASGVPFEEVYPAAPTPATPPWLADRDDWYAQTSAAASTATAVAERELPTPEWLREEAEKADADPDPAGWASAMSIPVPAEIQEQGPGAAAEYIARKADEESSDGGGTVYDDPEFIDAVDNAAAERIERESPEKSSAAEAVAAAHAAVEKVEPVEAPPAADAPVTSDSTVDDSSAVAVDDPGDDQ